VAPNCQQRRASQPRELKPDAHVAVSRRVRPCGTPSHRPATKPSGTDTGWAYRCTRTRRTGPSDEASG
jgi:hypothetical protein